MAKKIITFEASDDLYKQLRELAFYNESTVSALIRQLLESEIREYKKNLASIKQENETLKAESN